MDVRDVTRQLEECPLGINVNFLTDDDARGRPEIGLADSLANLGVRQVRYPGGEKSDAFYWTQPPWPSSRTERLRPGLTRTGPYEWPANSNFTLSDSATLVPEVLDFNEFMGACQAIACDPIIVVAADSYHIPASELGSAPTREKLLESAVEWVRYANHTMGYDVKYWMIGNESWNVNFNGGTDALSYARDVIDFSAAMKTVDPSIKIIANGRTTRWWRTVLSQAASHIDYLGVSSYPVTGWRAYERYIGSSASLDREAKVAVDAIRRFAPADAADRLMVMVTEMNSINFQSDGWHNNNDIGHALVVAQAVGDMLQHPKVASIQLWTTRWIDIDSRVIPHTRDSIDRSGRLQPSGWALSIWSRTLLENVLETDGEGDIVSYASADASNQYLNVVLINKRRRPQATNLWIDGFGIKLIARLSSFQGRTPDDLSPDWSTKSLSPEGPRIDVELPPLSVSVVKIEKASVESYKPICNVSVSSRLPLATRGKQ